MDKKNISKEDLERAQRLRNVRTGSLLTQEKMAERLDIGYSVYQRLETGRNNITFSHLAKLREEFGVSADYILFGEINDENHFEIDYEGMSEKDKFSILVRLMAHLCKLDEASYKQLLSDIEEHLK